MNGSRDYYTKSEKEKHTIDVTYLWKLNMIQMKLSTQQKWTHTHRKQSCHCQGGGEWGGKN